MNRKLIPMADAAKLLFLDTDQFLSNTHRIPFPVEVRDSVPLWDRMELIAFRRNGCPRLQHWYEGKPPSMLNRVKKILNELADQPFTGGAAR